MRTLTMHKFFIILSVIIVSLTLNALVHQSVFNRDLLENSPTQHTTQTIVTSNTTDLSRSPVEVTSYKQTLPMLQNTDFGESTTVDMHNINQKSQIVQNPAQPHTFPNSSSFQKNFKKFPEKKPKNLANSANSNIHSTNEIIGNAQPPFNKPLVASKNWRDEKNNLEISSNNEKSKIVEVRPRTTHIVGKQEILSTFAVKESTTQEGRSVEKEFQNTTNHTSKPSSESGAKGVDLFPMENSTLPNELSDIQEKTTSTENSILKEKEMWLFPPISDEEKPIERFPPVVDHNRSEPKVPVVPYEPVYAPISPHFGLKEPVSIPSEEPVEKENSIQDILIIDGVFDLGSKGEMVDFPPVD